MLTFAILVGVGLVIVGVLGWSWRINMMLNQPEKYRQVREFEKEHQDRQMEVLSKLTGPASRIAGRYFKR